MCKLSMREEMRLEGLRGRRLAPANDSRSSNCRRSLAEYGALGSKSGFVCGLVISVVTNGSYFNKE